MTAVTSRSGLRTARAARGWSQAEAARELVALARARGVPVATPSSLKTQLSRWENGHALPDAPYRALLGTLYDGAELGLEDAAEIADPAQRLRARVATASAVDADVIALWRDQLTAAQGLDDRLGAAGAGESVSVLVGQLEAVLPHLPDPGRRRPVAALLARADLLAATQALDTGDPDAALVRYARAGELAREAGEPALAVDATLGHVEALLDVDEPQAALAVLAHAEPDRVPRATRARIAAAVARAATVDAPRLPDTVDRTSPAPGLAVELAAGPRSVRTRAMLHAELARALAAAGRADEAVEHARTARGLARRIGSHRVLRRLDGHAPVQPPVPTAPSSSSAAR
jgi:transcriptional regulator with XRE-family HTH domain